MKSVAIFTLGCKVNQYESESMAAQFRKSGFNVIDWKEKADLYIVHTCAVTAQAAAKSRQQIHQAHRRNPEAPIAVMGCYAQMEGETIAAMPGVQFVVGTTERQQFLDHLMDLQETQETDLIQSYVRDFLPNEIFEEMKGLEQDDYSRPMLKIQEGCNNFCSYCIIPYLRGPERSRPQEQILMEARALVAQGYRELVLTGIHLSAWGKDFNPPQHITVLMKALTEIEDLQRLRISSVEPTDLDELWLNFAASESKFCKHLHIPLQSGCDTVLKRMNRRYDTATFRKLIKDFRTRVPNLAITTDLIVGFPGETEEEALETLDFCREMKFSRMHVFRFSARKGTQAARLPDAVAKEIGEQRSLAIRNLAEEMAAEYGKSFVGRELEVLLEENNSVLGYAEGYSQEYIRVRVATTGEIPRCGRVVRVRGREWFENRLFAELL